jgi:hypothetical protein
VILLGDVEDIDAEGRTFRRPWRLPEDCSVLEDVIVRLGIETITVDGLGYSIKGDSHNYAIIGSALSALAGVAERTGCAILGLTHPPKGASDPVTAAVGSTAWTAIARIVWLLGVHPEDESGARRVVTVSKSNYRMPDSGLSFTIGNDEQYECGFVTGLSSSSVTAEDLAAASVPASERTSREEARAMVKAILKKGPMETSELLKLTRGAGISDRTVDRARSDLGAKASPQHAPDGKMTSWMVSLPDQSATPPNHTDSPLLGGVGAVGAVVVTRDNEMPRGTSPPSPPSPSERGLVRAESLEGDDF